MQRPLLVPALALALLLPACVSAAARASGAGSGGRAVTVLVRNGTTDALRVTARGTRGARLQPGQSACLVFNDAAQPVSLNAVAVGSAGRAAPSPDGSIRPERRPGSTTVGSEGVMVSPSFVPMAAAAWRWELGVQSGRRVVDAVPVEVPCT